MTMNINELLRGGTCCLDTAGLAVGGTATHAKIAGTDPAGVNYAINGLMYYKANADDSIDFTGLTQATLTTCLYTVCLDSAGTVTVVQGTAVTTADLTAGTAVLHWPTPTANTCPIGAIKLVLTGAFTGGTTELSAATVTDTYYNFFCQPVAPLTS